MINMHHELKIKDKPKEKKLDSFLWTEVCWLTSHLIFGRTDIRKPCKDTKSNLTHMQRYQTYVDPTLFPNRYKPNKK